MRWNIWYKNMETMFYLYIQEQYQWWMKMVYQASKHFFSAKNTLNDIQGEFCFADEDGYHYRVLERDILYNDDITKSLSKITYWAIKGAISDAAAIYEAKNRILGQDFRRIMFSKELQYLNAIGKEYAEMAELEYDNILKVNPFRDWRNK